MKNVKMKKLLKAINEKQDSAWKYLHDPLNLKINDFLRGGFKLNRVDIGFFLSVYLLTSLSACQDEANKQETKTPIVQSEQQAVSEVPAIKIFDNKLFVDGSEILAKDFVKKYCFAKRDNQTCVEALILDGIQARNAGGEKPKNW